MKKFTALFISALLFLTLCACGEKHTPLFEKYSSEIISGIAAQMPDRMNLQVETDSVSSSAYGIGDEAFIKSFSDSFVKVNAVKKIKQDSFKAEFSAELFRGDESAVMKFGGDCAEVITDNGVEYYKISEYEDFFAVMTAYSKEDEAAMENYDILVNEQNIKVYAEKTVSFAENGSPAVGIYVFNGQNTATGIFLSDIKVNGENKPDSEKNYLESGSEAGFEIPVSNDGEDEIKSVSFCVKVLSGINDEASPFIVSDEYEIKP